MRAVSRQLAGFLVVTGFWTYGCQSSSSAPSFRQQLAGNWSGTYYQVYEAKSTASPENDLAQSLSPVNFEILGEAIEFRVGEDGIQVNQVGKNPVKFDLIMVDSTARTLQCMVTTGEGAKAHYTVLNLTPDSLIMRQNANFMHFDKNGNSVNPDTVLKEVLFRLRKV